MNERQLKAIEKLESNNENYIKELEKIHKEMLDAYKGYDSFEKEFWDKLNKMEKAHSQIYFKPYSDAYCVKNGDFSIPSAPCIENDLYGQVNEEFKFLTPKGIEDIYNDIKSHSNEFKETIEEFYQVLNPLIEDIIAANSITQRLVGLQDKLGEIETLNSNKWYLRKLSKNEYTPSGQFVVPLSLSRSYVQFSLPIHRQILIEFEYVIKTKYIQLNIVQGIKSILKYINEFLPFAELAPFIKQDGSNNVIIHNKNDISDNRTEIGSHTKIGNNNAIGDNAKIEGEV